MMTYLQPASTSILVAISPVYAPEALALQFSAPMPTRVSRMARTAAGMQTAGTHSATSHQRPLGIMAFSLAMNSLVSEGVLFIFQLPAMTVLRYFLFIVEILLYLSIIR